MVPGNPKTNANLAVGRNREKAIPPRSSRGKHCLLFKQNQKNRVERRIKIQAITNFFFVINIFVLFKKNKIKKNIIEPFIKFDLSPEIKIHNGTISRNMLKKIFDFKVKFWLKK